MKRSRNAVISATIASASGIAVATSVRKTTSSTMSAASRPRSSCVPCSIGGNSASPLNSTTTPSAATPSRTASWTASTCLAVLVVDDAVELCLRVGDATVLGERVLAEGVSDALDARALVRSDRCELGRSQLGDCRHDRGLARRRLVESLALRCREDEVEHAALLGGELGLDQIRCLLRLGARDRELVLQAPADGGDEEDEAGDDPDPGDHHAPRMVRAGAHPARECASRESFVGGQPPRVGSQRRARSSLYPHMIVFRETGKPSTTHRWLRAFRQRIRKLDSSDAR